MRSRNELRRQLFVIRVTKSARQSSIRWFADHATNWQATNKRSRNRLSEMERWASHLPKEVRVLPGAFKLVGRTAVVPVTLSLKIPDAQQSSRDISSDAILSLRLGAREKWIVTDVQSARTGLRAVDQPIYVHRANVGILAPYSRSDFAHESLETALAAIPDIRKRYAAVAGPLHSFILIAESAKVAAALDLGMQGTEYPDAYTLNSGDIVLLMSRLSKVEYRQQLSTVVHEITHFITLSLAKVASSTLNEGIATYEEARYLKRFDYFLNVDHLNSAYSNGTIHFQQLLTTKDSQFDLTDPDAIDNAYLNAFATVAYVESSLGHRKLIAWLSLAKDGIVIQTATKRALGITVETLEQRVKSWAASHPRGIT